jgi:DNA-binding GntR family transcriptional regulator
LEKLEHAAAAGDLAIFFHEDIAFHRMIWDAADNPYALRALESMMGSLFASGLMDSHHGVSIDLLAEVEKHRRLFDALSSRDPQRAALALLEIAAGFERHLKTSTP